MHGEECSCVSPCVCMGLMRLWQELCRFACGGTAVSMFRTRLCGGLGGQDGGRLLGTTMRLDMQWLSGAGLDTMERLLLCPDLSGVLDALCCFKGV